MLQESDAATTAYDESSDNTLTGSYSATTVSTNDSSVNETGAISGGGGYDLSKTVTGSTSQATSGNDIGGTYTTTELAANTTVSQESTYNSTADATFTEAVADNASTLETGDSVTGAYTRGITDATTTTDTDTYTPTSGNAVTVGESSSQATTGTQTGNYVSGDYTLSETTSDAYSMSEQSGWTLGGVGGGGTGGTGGGRRRCLGGTSVTTGGGGTGSSTTTPSVGAFSLTETGNDGFTTTETGNTVAGGYTRSETGTDVYSMNEVGQNSGGSFSEVVTGTDTPSLTEVGNSANQTYNRTIVGTGTYTRTDSGPGATLSNGSGSLGYTLTESSDARAGMLSQSKTGTDRYGLLERYVNVANTGSDAPGNMDYYPFGQPWVDPTGDTLADAARMDQVTPENASKNRIYTDEMLNLMVQTLLQSGTAALKKKNAGMMLTPAEESTLKQLAGAAALYKILGDAGKAGKQLAVNISYINNGIGDIKFAVLAKDAKAGSINVYIGHGLSADPLGNKKASDGAVDIVQNQFQTTDRKFKNDKENAPKFAFNCCFAGAFNNAVPQYMRIEGYAKTQDSIQTLDLWSHYGPVMVEILRIIEENRDNGKATTVNFYIGEFEKRTPTTGQTIPADGSYRMGNWAKQPAK